MVFEEQVTDEELLKAYFRACMRPKIAASQVHDELGKSISVRRVKERMQDLTIKGKLNELISDDELKEFVKEGCLRGELRGSTWVFWIEE